MKEKPILFSGPMVQAILEGRKTQTRRVADTLRGFGKVTEFGSSDTPGYDWTFRDRRMCWNDLRHADLLARCPYGQPGDRLWVRESLINDGDGDWQYSADGAWLKTPDGGLPGKWASKPAIPSIHMPRWASRITLEVTEVRVQRLQDISEEDAKAEGVEPDDRFIDHYKSYLNSGHYPSARGSFISLWDSINGKRPGCDWTSNPWVWAVSFKRLP